MTLSLVGTSLLAFTLAGVLQVLWLKSPLFRRFAYPLDGGIRLGEMDVFGPNKTVAGFMVMVPATALMFPLFGLVFPHWFWPGQSDTLFVGGLSAGMGYMLGELPNSFIKRRLGIASGEEPTGRLGRSLSFIVDQVDSVIGAVLGLTLVWEVSYEVAALILVGGGLIHWAFNLLLYGIGLKARAR